MPRKRESTSSTSGSDTFSSVNRRTLLLGASAALATLLAGAAEAKVFLTQEEALKLAFPGSTVEHKTAFLTPAQQKAAQTLSRDEELPAALVNFYVATKDGSDVGMAYFDTHVVRTMPETIMVVVDPAGAIARIEVLSFLEPEEYLPRARWYEQFAGKPLSDELSTKRGIHPVTGATLTVRATTDAARRVLALHRILHTPAVPTPAPSPSPTRGAPR
jgi:Na+-translocating ferredoxin:NAD+ oxidoreductase RnfG subunit